MLLRSLATPTCRFCLLRDEDDYSAFPNLYSLTHNKDCSVCHLGLAIIFSESIFAHPRHPGLLFIYELQLGWIARQRSLTCHC